MLVLCKSLRFSHLATMLKPMRAGLAYPADVAIWDASNPAISENFLMLLRRESSGSNPKFVIAQAKNLYDSQR